MDSTIQGNDSVGWETPPKGLGLYNPWNPTSPTIVGQSYAANYMNYVLLHVMRYIQFIMSNSGGINLFKKGYSS